MKVSELVGQLAQIVEKFGDIEVFVMEPMDERDALFFPLVELDVNEDEDSVNRVELTYGGPYIHFVGFSKEGGGAASTEEIANTCEKLGWTIDSVEDADAGCYHVNVGSTYDTLIRNQRGLEEEVDGVLVNVEWY